MPIAFFYELLLWLIIFVILMHILISYVLHFHHCVELLFEYTMIAFNHFPLLNIWFISHSWLLQGCHEHSYTCCLGDVVTSFHKTMYLLGFWQKKTVI